MSQRRDSRVDDYIAQLPAWQQDVYQQLRALAHAADDGVEETIKRSIQPYFVLEGNICALLAAQAHVNVFTYDPTVPDPSGVINQGHGTRPRERSRSARARTSNQGQCSTCSGQSSPTTEREDGGVSSPDLLGQ